ncbi:hypothetical protein [Alkaliphilus serpentinus]|uniref:Uncharacterized protein n=1 Tax=Alkaliphilus serpentinus TaxID=1482731 RepID=A0A833HM92_9FIRM|nr:hypothetical protein [Alkaliphilus serpentinus]KAB3527202.1 hypothetical protein F8153_12835 [Alkaliphilus serpentinus]
MYHSAIPSWYGYRYQGQLAIYYALKQIYDISGKINESDNIRKEYLFKEQLEKYALEIEYMEDFAIRYYKNDSEFEYISFHQVKAGESNRKIDNVTIYGVLDKLIKHQSYTDENSNTKKTKGYIHVPSINHELESNDFKKIYSEQRDKYFNELNEILRVQEDWDELVKHIKGTGKKSTIKMILHNKLRKSNIEKDVKNHEDIKRILLGIYREIKESNFPDSGVDVNIYSDEYFRSINEIENKIISVVIELHSRFNQYRDFMNYQSVKKKVLPQLIQEITRHIDNRKNNYQSDPFIKLIDIYKLIVDVPEEIDLNYEAYRFKVNIIDKFPEYTNIYCDDFL